MKKYLLIFVAFFMILFSGCTNNSNPVDNSKTYETLNEIQEWLTTQIPATTTTDVTLPTTHPELGGVITWETMSEDLISNDGTVTLPDTIEEAFIGYKITLNDLSVEDVVSIYVSSLTLDRIGDEFIGQFNAVITRDYDIKSTFYNNFIVTWTSSNPDVFTNDGIYIRPANDTTITINYTVTFGGESKQFSKDFMVKGVLFSEKAREITNWIEDNYLPSRLIEQEIELPLEYEKYNATISWRSSNVDVISTDGKVKQFAFDRYLTLQAIIESGEDYYTSEFSLIVKAKPVTTFAEKLDSFLSAIGVSEIENLAFTAYQGINQSFNYLPFYVNEDAPVVQQIIPVGGSRPGTKLYSVEFVTIHDTASTGATANAKRHADILTNGYTASWHFAIDEDGAYQSIPLDEVAWHAGDGSRQFKLTDTGVKATYAFPKITISEDGYYEFNGTKSGIVAPTRNGIILDASYLTPSGIYTEIGENGNYFVNNTYYSEDYNKISNAGGNRNSIGIETCVNYGNDYALTLRHTAKLVAGILIDNNLDVTRVLQHNNFSGKDCPNAMRHLNYWNTFLDIISMEKFAQQEFANVDFVWTSQSTILANNGKIALDLQGASEVHYTVTATYDNQTVVKEFSTTLIK